MKIIIEGFEDKPVVIDDIKQFVLYVENEAGDMTEVVACCNAFLAFAAMKTQAHFFMKEMQEMEGNYDNNESRVN